VQPAFNFDISLLLFREAPNGVNSVLAEQSKNGGNPAENLMSAAEE
jgi:hypothetical protein